MVSYINGGMQAEGILEEDPEGWKRELRRLHDELLHSLYHSPNTVRVIKSIRLRENEGVIRRKIDQMDKLYFKNNNGLLKRDFMKIF